MNEIDGECLHKCTSIERLAQLGIEAEVKALILLENIENYRKTGVPLELIIPTTGTLIGSH